MLGAIIIELMDTEPFLRGISELNLGLGVRMGQPTLISGSERDFLMGFLGLQHIILLDLTLAAHKRTANDVNYFPIHVSIRMRNEHRLMNRNFFFSYGKPPRIVCRSL